MWILFSVLTVALQTVRNTYSKKLLKNVSSMTATLCRFIFGLPIAIIIFLILRYFYGDIKIISKIFFLWTFLFAISQSLGNTFFVAHQ